MSDCKFVFRAEFHKMGAFCDPFSSSKMKPRNACVFPNSFQSSGFNFWNQFFGLKSGTNQSSKKLWNGTFEAFPKFSRPAATSVWSDRMF